MGHEVDVLGLDSILSDLTKKLEQNSYQKVFNLLEQFNNDVKLDANIVALLELYNVSFTGCNSKGLALARDKALAKKILSYHNIKTPHFFTIPIDKRRKIPKNLKYPQIVKCLYEEASYGIAKASVATSFEKLQQRVEYLHDQLSQDVIVEEFITGKEMSVGVIGNNQLRVFPVWELVYENSEAPEKEIYSQSAKWNDNYRKRLGIKTKKADISPELEEKIQKVAKRAYRCLNLSGYARVDFRINENEIFVLEVNPNPNIAQDDELAIAAKYAGVDYQQLISKLLQIS